MKSDGLYERVLEQVGKGGQLPQPRPPRASASVVPWRESDVGLEVYWVKRAESLPFMGGWRAFPGGGLSRRDQDVEVTGKPQRLDEAPRDGAVPEAVLDGVSDLGPIDPPGLLICAVRELFEETGLLLGTPTGTPNAEAALTNQLRRLRRQLLAKEIDFAAMLSSTKLAPEVSELVYAGRWLTPPLGPMRFDNRFFLLNWQETRAMQPEIVVGELESGEWVQPAMALQRWRDGEVLVAPPILHVLKVLEEAGPVGGLERPEKQELAGEVAFPQVVLHIQCFFGESGNREAGTEGIAGIRQQLNTRQGLILRCCFCNECAQRRMLRVLITLAGDLLQIVR